MFKIDVLASSSAGNCYIVSYGDKHFMIECGIPIRDISKKMLKLGLNFNDISFCLISHKHNDHSLAAKDVAKRGIEVIGPKGIEGVKQTITDKEIIRFEDFTIIPFQVAHGECECYGYYITTAGKKERLVFATDCTLIKAKLDDLDITQLMIECNYLDENIQGNKYRERRQVNTHMSVNGCLKHIEKIATIWLKEVYLIHMSAAYGDTLISKAMVQAKLKEMNIDATVYVANERGGVC